MAEHRIGQLFYVPATNAERVPPPRISGTAVVGGVHLSTGNYGTISPWRLMVSGAAIAALLAPAMILTFIEFWLLERFWGQGLTDVIWGVSAVTVSKYAHTATPIFSFLNFLLMLRLSPLSGYHAAEHKVVAAIEKYGQLERDQVLTMPRAHPRCGTVLLLGILPAALIAYPLYSTNPLAAIMVAALGWLLRYRVGYFIQQHFTTKPPTPGQMEAGLQAGHRLMTLWSSDPRRRVTTVQNLWIRGLPQLLVGVFAGQHLLSYIMSHLHIWLDW